MKTIPSGLLAVYASGGATICACLVVQRPEGTYERFTSTDADVTVSGAGAPYDGTYQASTGLDVSNLVSQSNAAVDNMEMTVLPDEVSYPQNDILAGLWDNSPFWLFETSWLDPTLGINLLKRGETGEAKTIRVNRNFEFRGLKQAWQQSVGAVTSRTCRARLGDAKCTIDLASTDGWTNTYATTAVASRHVVTCSAATEVDDFYGDGIATGITGPNAGFAQKIKSFAAGVFTFSLAFPYTIGIGDTFEFQAGCRKRLDEDCKTKFDNVLNFQGEPHVPGTDLLTADPDLG